MIDFSQVRLLAFDADDTLWDCQNHFDRAEEEYAGILESYRSEGQPAPREALFEVESRNMPLLGYGCKAFAISLIENAIEYSRHRISASEMARIIELGKVLLNLPATPLEGVEDTLRELHHLHRYWLVVFTKGEILDQENKLRRSGLLPYFDDVVIVSDKTPESYQKLCARHGVGLEEMLMIGNSFKSDVAPVLQLGGNAIYIPFDAVWQHEVVDEYDHSRLCRVDKFADILAYLK
ncbi:HAD family hydrolase [Prevotella sp. KH2C16]|uniref:HAD family hydrolase n=1 Tax=Prevotella sp. KH2C16 TaxID=1855325 RepID=UPI0008E1EA29|nr:HAD family hydrolase [Prevotella sp. KH2C16]SFF91920.1 putative hydrolase of the HAD superfamily [Prevotella sp. KH2C16]